MRTVSITTAWKHRPLYLHVQNVNRINVHFMLYKQGHVMKVKQFLLRVLIVESAGSATLNYGDRISQSSPNLPFSNIPSPHLAKGVE